MPWSVRPPLVVCLAVVALALVAPGASATARPRVIQLPRALEYTGLSADGGAVAVDGSTARGACVSYPLAVRSFRLGAAHHQPCGASPTCPNAYPATTTYDRGPTTCAAVSPVVQSPYSSHARVVMETGGPSAAKVVGPALFTFDDSSDTHPEWVDGNGIVWVFDAATPTGAELVCTSATTGAVLGRLAVPLAPFRPAMSVDDDGLWMAIEPNGGYTSSSGDAPIYHVADSCNSVTVVHRQGTSVLWLVASGHSVWVDVNFGDRQQFWRFEGPAATPSQLASSPALVSFAAIGNEEDGLFVTMPTNSGSHGAQSCNRLDIMRIDPDDGLTSVVGVVKTAQVNCAVAEVSTAMVLTGRLLVVLAGTYEATTAELVRVPIGSAD